MRPSSILCIDDEYTAYCFDEACMVIIDKLKDKQKPYFGKYKNNSSGSSMRPHFSSMSKMYESMGYELNTYKKYRYDE